MKSKTKKKTARNSASKKAARGRAAKKGVRNKAKDHPESAIALLTQDHKKVQDIFRDFRKLMKNGGDDDEKRRMVMQACEMLTIHSEIEEEIFYSQVRRAIQDGEIMDEALVEHDGAKELIEQLRQMEPGDRLYDAKFIVLGEQIKHHIEEEEGKIFPKARKAGLDLVRIGQDMMDLKDDLEGRNKERMRPRFQNDMRYRDQQDDRNAYYR
jgi:hemerythrin-like domain-containing protein